MSLEEKQRRGTVSALTLVQREHAVGVEEPGR